ncbi:hypothetical protein F5I97DRAFT_1895366 [Phlebopus sp. FC_14]|nr:hypothetical protein F5I97DRAFT_1895366 [Phlebopus sp. FC_14]
MNREYDWQGFYSELALYKSERYLKPLQGDVVPHIIGVHAMPEAISVTMELPHPSFWIESSPSMPNVLKERVIAAFEKIHAHGVLHGDPELRHMLIGADGRVMIIDFGMSRAIREHELVGIEQVGPEEFRLEMRKVKYKLDYMGARKKEADKTAGYLKRVQRNGRLEQLWARRKAGQRTGPITEEVEEDPEEYKLDPPVSAEDLEEDWDAALDHEPVRVVVPGQSEKEVAREVEAFMEILARMRTLPRGEQAAQASSSTNPPPYPYYPSPWTSSGDRVHMWYSDEFDGGTELSKPPITTIAASSLAIQIRKENIDRCYQYGLPHEDPFGSGDGKGKGTRKRRRSLGNMLRRQEREKHGTRYVSIVEKAAMRSKYLRVKRMKNGHIATLAGAENMSGIEMGPKEMAEIDFGEGRGTLKDVPEGPRILQEEEYQMIAEGRRQAVVRCTQAPRGILKRRREDEGFGAFEKPTNSVEPLNGDDVRAMGGGHEEEKEGPARKKRRTASAVPIGRRPGEMLRPRLGRREEEDAQGGQSGGLPPFVSKVSSLIGSLLARMG